MNKIKTFKGLEYGRTQETTNILKRVFGDFYRDPRTPSTDLVQEIQNPSQWSRSPIGTFKSTTDKPLVFNKANLYILGAMGAIGLYFLFK